MPPAEAPGSSERRFALIAAAVIAAAAALAYANSFSVPLLFDDWVTLLKNPKLRDPWPIWEALRPPEHTGVGGRPIANLSFVLNYAVTGDAVPGFHAVNLAIHIAAGLALFGLARRTLLRIGWAAASGKLALAIAAWWTLQPLQTQSVTYVSQRTESLMGLFYFVTLYCYARATEAGAGRRWAVFSVASCFAGVATKEGMATAPLMALLYDWAFAAGSPRAAWRLRWRLLLSLAASWLLLAALTSGLHGRGVGFGHGMTPWAYLLIECRAIVRYFVLSLWPWPLVFDYGVDLAASGVVTALAVVAVAALGGASVAAWFRRPAWGFLGAWFLVTLAPTSSVVPLPLQPISENRAYVPSAAVIAAALVAAHACTGGRGWRAYAAAAAALAGLAALRNHDYRSEVSIWADTVAKRPASSRAHSNYGQALQAAGRVAEAKAHYEAALRLRPTYADAHRNLGGLLGQLGDHDAAVTHNRRATELDPRNAAAFYNLGVALTQKGDLDGAIAAYRESLRLRPLTPEAHANLALLLVRANQPAEAIAHGEAAARLDPGNVDGRFAIGCALLMTNRLAEAAPQFAAVVRLRPNHAEAYHNLGLALQQSGNLAGAIESYQTALRWNPNQHDTQLNLGLALVQSGRPDEAVPHFAAALRLNPASPVAKQQLERLLGRAAPAPAPR